MDSNLKRMKTKEQLLCEIEDVLIHLSPHLTFHGGGIELVDFDPGTGLVTVRLTGRCAHCQMADVTLKHGIEHALIQAIPEVKSVVNVLGSDDNIPL